MAKTNSFSIAAAKKAAGEEAAKWVRSDMVIGLGTGSTTAYFIEALGRRCREENLNIRAVASSLESQRKAEEQGIPLQSEQSILTLDLTVDGADEIDPQKNMIKGGGGALLREKLLASCSQQMIVIVDENKVVQHLGAFPVPVEISPFVYLTTIRRLENQGYQGKLRIKQDQTPYVTDNGHYIFDVSFNRVIDRPKEEHEKLRLITGVLETGLFFHLATRVIIGYSDGFVKIQT